MEIFRLIPKYGNWGGIGWSGGSYPKSPKETDWNVVAVDTMDEVFKIHDREYQLAISLYNEKKIDKNLMYRMWDKADKKLIKTLKKIHWNPKKWKKSSENFLYAFFYRKLAIWFFFLKTFLMVPEKRRNIPLNWIERK